ncbi:MAG: hypothetical protein HY927_15240 [Elusimicrobia bacterium]|nr:hypothetical protein [Elusimicrobiota bacterium]
MAERVFPWAAAALRRALARLPIKEKVRLLVEMQKTANDIRRRCGRPELPAWRI